MGGNYDSSHVRSRHQRRSTPPAPHRSGAGWWGVAAVEHTAAAQPEEPEEIEFRIFKVNCEEDPGDDIPPIVEQIPEGCEAAEGVSFTVSDTDGNELASCTTDDGGLCIVEVPNGAEVVVEEDVTTGEQGYSPLENPIETTAVTEFAGAQFINVRDDVPELPKTGSGDAAMRLSTGMAGTFAVLATLLALSGALVRRPGGR